MLAGSGSRTKRTEILEIDGTIHIPAGLQSDPRFIMPDEVVADRVREYQLAAPGLRGIDPMCGVGTIPRVIAAMGGICDAIELDIYQYTVAKAELPTEAVIIYGDCLLVQPTTTYDYIYTSMPFAWFEHSNGPDAAFAQVFRRMLKPGGILILDSDDIARRNGRTWPLAELQIAFFTAHGFRCNEAKRFIAKNPHAKQDSTFTELTFTLDTI